MSACSFANISSLLERKNLIPESQSLPGNNFIPAWKEGKPAAFVVNVTTSPKSNSHTNAATKAGYALDAADEEKNCLYDNNFAKIGITFVPLAIVVLGGISATFKKTLKRSLRAQGFSVAFVNSYDPC